MASLSPPGYTPIEEVEYTFKILALYTAYGAALAPMLVSYWLLSTESLRRRPIFWLLTLSYLMGITLTILNGPDVFLLVTRPNSPPPQGLYLAGNFFSYFTPLVTDSTLIFKILAFFPKQSTSLLKRSLVVALPVLIKAPRLGVISAYLNQQRVALNEKGFEAAVAVAGNSVFLKVELVMQLVDNLYSAGFFLITVYQFRIRHVRSTSQTHSFRQLSSSGSAVFNSLTWLLESAIFTFTVPVILQIVQLALLYSGEGGITYTSVFVSNVYLSIIFASLATVWSTIRGPRESPTTTRTAFSTEHQSGSQSRGGNLELSPRGDSGSEPSQRVTSPYQSTFNEYGSNPRLAKPFVTQEVETVRDDEGSFDEVKGAANWEAR